MANLLLHRLTYCIFSHFVRICIILLQKEVKDQEELDKKKAEENDGKWDFIPI